METNKEICKAFKGWPEASFLPFAGKDHNSTSDIFNIQGDKLLKKQHDLTGKEDRVLEVIVSI